MIISLRLKLLDCYLKILYKRKTPEAAHNNYGCNIVQIAKRENLVTNSQPYKVILTHILYGSSRLATAKVATMTIGNSAKAAIFVLVFYILDC
jgi:hypothetical protein